MHEESMQNVTNTHLFNLSKRCALEQFIMIVEEWPKKLTCVKKKKKKEKNKVRMANKII